MYAQRGWRALLATSVLVLVATLLVSCASDVLVREQLAEKLASRVKDTQDYIWYDRDALLADPEAALLADVYADERPRFDDPTIPPPPGSHAVIDVVDEPDALTLTMMEGAGHGTGGGLFSMSFTGRTCFRLTLPRDRAEILTERADCTDRAGRGIDVIGFTQTWMFDLDSLDVDTLIDASDHQPLPCQCISGRPCDCPGG